MIRQFFLMAALSHALVAHSQFAVGSESNAVVIKAGEIFHFDGLTLTPHSDITLVSTTLTKTDATTISPSLANAYISRYFSFTNSTPSFSGTVRFSYAGASLNGIPEADLRLNVRVNGTSWLDYTDAPDISNDIVQSTLTATTLNTLTLANNSAPLPVTWLDFMAVNRNGHSSLHWITVTEINSKNFIVQHSTNTQVWTNIGNVLASGQSVTQQKYYFIHETPRTGYNYYRLIQQDMDGRSVYSKVVSVWIDKGPTKLVASPNPVTNGTIQLEISEPMDLRLFNSSGKLVRQKWFGSGIQTWHLSDLPGGMYYLNGSGETITLFIK
jgi:hypothetical protein